MIGNKIIGSKININGVEYIIPKGYPKFGFAENEQGKYSVACIKNKTVTPYFIDEIRLSDEEHPLETWTAEYVICRTAHDGKYHLMDPEGNCYFDEEEPYVICRNGFLTRNMKHFIAKGLSLKGVSDIEKSTGMILKFDFVSHGGYNFALTNPGKELLDVNGKICERVSNISRGDISFYGLENWNYRNLRDYDGILYRILNKDFKVIAKAKNLSIISSKYGVCRFENSDLYSSLLGRKISDCKEVGSFFFVWYDDETHIYLPDDKEEHLDCLASVPLNTGEFIIYRVKRELIVRDLNSGKITEKVLLSTKEAYDFMLKENKAL